MSIFALSQYFFNSFSQYFSFLNINFNRFCPLEKRRVTPHCLYRDSLTLMDIFNFLRCKKVNEDNQDLFNRYYIGNDLNNFRTDSNILDRDFSKNNTGFELLTIFIKSSILDVWLNFEYASTFAFKLAQVVYMYFVYVFPTK